MELMNSSVNIAGTIPKIVEMPEHFIINTQYYDKQTLKPIPMKFHMFSEINRNHLCLGTSLEKSYSAGESQFIQHAYTNNETNKEQIFYDKYDPNIFYCVFQGNSSPNSWEMCYLNKMTYVNNEYKTLNLFSSYLSLSSYCHKGDLKILYENKDMFLITIINQYATHIDSTSLACSIGILNKSNFNYTRLDMYLATDYLSKYYFLHEENNNVYIMVQRLITSNMYNIVKINLSNQLFSAIYTFARTTTLAINCNPLEIDGYFYICRIETIDSVNTYVLDKISIDYSTDTVEKEIININPYQYSFVPPDNSNYTYITLRTIKKNNNTYISLLMHGPRNTTVNYAKNYLSYHKLITLKLNESSCDIIDYIPLTSGCEGSLIYNDSEHIVLLMSDCILFYVFDSIKEKMICTYRISGNFRQIGFDLLNRFFAVANDYSIITLTQTNACVLKADFAEEVYDRKSDNIETTVSFYAKNCLDEYVETEVKLTLIGPVVFKENNLKTLIISSLDTGIRSVPVIITGYGKIEVIITQNT